MVEKSDSHDGAIKRVAAELNKTSPEQVPPTENSGVLNRDEVLSDAKQGEVFSIKTQRPVNPDAPRGIVSEQKKEFETIKAEEPEGKSEETASENVSNELSPEFEKVRSEWKETRDRAHKVEEEYRQKYQEHVLAQTKGIRGLIGVPRRVFGLKPRLNRELESLQEASLAARVDYKEAGLKLKEAKSAKDKTIGELERLSSRYQRMLAHHLTVAVHKERLAKQKEGRGQAWEESKYLRPTMEGLGKYKYTVGAVALGAGILTAGIVPVAAGVVAGVSTRFGLGRILDKTYVESARKNLAAGKEGVGNNFFETELTDLDEEIEHLTFDVDSREARAKTITNAAAIAAGVSAAGYVNGLGAESVNNLGDVSPDITIEQSSGDVIDSSTSGPDSTVDGPTPSDSTTSVEAPVDQLETSPTESGMEPEMDENSVSPNEQTIENEAATSVEPEARDYSLPPATSVPNLPPQGIVESVPQAPVDSPIVSQDPNLTPMTESEATAAFGTVQAPSFEGLTQSEANAAFGPVTGPSIESLQSADLVTHTVEKGENVWNIMEGKGPDANPVGGKSEVLEGMSLTERHAALDKLVEYAEQNPEFAKEVGALKSNGDIHRIYPGEEVNVSMLDDKLRELLGTAEAAPEPSVAPEAAIPTEEVSGTAVQPEPATEQVTEDVTEVPYSETAPEPADINSMRVGDILSLQEAVENGDPQILAELNEMGFDKDSYNALNEAISSNIRQGETYDMTLPLTEWMNQYGQPATPEPLPTSPQPESSPILDRVGYTPSDTGIVGQEAIAPMVENVESAAAIKEYVTGVEKSTSGFLFSGRPDVSGTFESLKGLSIGEFKGMAANDNLSTLLEERGVSFDGFERWGETLQKQVELIPANDTETLGDYVTRIASNNVRTA